MNENMVWTDSQDYGEDEILCTSKITLLYKTTRFTSEIITLFRVSPQLFTLLYKTTRFTSEIITLFRVSPVIHKIPTSKPTAKRESPIFLFFFHVDPDNMLAGLAGCKRMCNTHERL